MSEAEDLVYLRGRWPDDEVPPGEAEWMLYEISNTRDAALRSIDISSDGKITRNSIELEQRNGDHCPSLFDHSLKVSLAEAQLMIISKEEFEDQWTKGVDAPFWYPL